MEYQSIRFIDEPIEAHFNIPPIFEKKPGCPDAFSWQGEYFKVEVLLNEWHDYKRRGRMARNMQPGHSATAERRGSWGVGEFFYRVRTQGGRIFDIYFDRSPKDVNNRKGAWFLFRELAISTNQNNNSAL
jgi:hypothetical protein